MRGFSVVRIVKVFHRKRPISIAFIMIVPSDMDLEF